jgi:hypothetical protein
VQRRYDVAYMQCMYAKGNQIPMRGGVQRPRTSAPPVDGPPPPPRGSPPPPPPVDGPPPPPRGSPPPPPPESWR